MAAQNGKTALFSALEQGHGELFQFLLSKGADINARTTLAEDGEFDRPGQTMLHKAALFDNPPAIVVEDKCARG